MSKQTDLIEIIDSIIDKIDAGKDAEMDDMNVIIPLLGGDKEIKGIDLIFDTHRYLLLLFMSYILKQFPEEEDENT